MQTKEAFIYRFSHGFTVHVPAGSKVEPIRDEPNTFWVLPSVFPAASLARWDAEHYGIRVKADNVTE